eukprot:SAG31_NODE_3333_length_4395_cov_2.924814_3_plen_118_part_00
MGYFPTLGSSNSAGPSIPTSSGGSAGPKPAWGAAASRAPAPVPAPPSASDGERKSHWEVLGQTAKTSPADANFEEEERRPTEHVFFDFDAALAASAKQKSSKKKGKRNKGPALAMDD